MNKKWLFSMAVAAAAIEPAFVVTALAEQPTIADGTYEVNYFTYKAGTTETSGMANRFAKPAKLIVENGEARFAGDMQTETRTVELPIDTFEKAVPVQVEVMFPGAIEPVKQAFDLIVAPPAVTLKEEVVLTTYKFGTMEPLLMQQFVMSTAKIVYNENEAPAAGFQDIASVLTTDAERYNAINA